MRTIMVVVLMVVATLAWSQPSSTLFYGPKDLNFNILDYDSLRVWQTERDGHGIWWQDNATKDVFFLRTDTVGLYLWYLDNSAGTWTNVWSVDASGAQVADSTYLGDLKIGDDLVVTDDVTADSVYVRTVKTSAAGIFGTTLKATGTSTLDSTYARTVKTSGAASIGTTLGVTGAATLDSTYMRKLVLNAATKKVIDSVSAVHADTLAVWVGGTAFVLPKRP